MDPERFADDNEELMAGKEMGVIYTMTSDGRALRLLPDAKERQRLLEAYYYPHHERLEELIRDALATGAPALIIDAHSFPSSPLPCDLDQTRDRPDICIGTDHFHTPPWLQDTAEDAFRDQGWRVEPNRPYNGSIVPTSRLRNDERVYSIMIEINRALYMNEQTGERLACYGDVCRSVRCAVARIEACFGRVAEAYIRQDRDSP